VADRSTEAEKAARRALDEARERSHDLARRYGQAITFAIQREQERTSAQLGGRRPLYQQGAVLLRLTSEEAQLRKRLDAATVAVTEAEAAYVRTCKLASTRPRR
jgi:hypothetical protein